jgi:hypothetical protein
MRTKEIIMINTTILSMATMSKELQHSQVKESLMAIIVVAISFITKSLPLIERDQIAPLLRERS